jgi:hypothetical protein
MKKIEEYGLIGVVTTIITSSMFFVGIGLVSRLAWECLRLGWNLTEWIFGL